MGLIPIGIDSIEPDEEQGDCDKDTDDRRNSRSIACFCCHVTFSSSLVVAPWSDCCKLDVSHNQNPAQSIENTILPYFPMRTSSLLFLFLVSCASLVIAEQPVGIRLFPASIELNHENSEQQFLIQSALSDGTTGVAIDAIPKFQFLGPEIVTI